MQTQPEPRPVCASCGGAHGPAPRFEDLGTTDLLKVWIRINSRISVELLRRETARLRAEAEADELLNEVVASG